MNRFILPLGLFAILVAFLAVGLTLNPREVPSPLVNKPVPPFKLAQLEQPSLEFSHKDMLGQVWLLNVWASWCTSCKEEHPVLMGLSREAQVPLIGFNYQDQAEAGRAWLAQQGDPYRLTVTDPDGRAGLDLGVVGVPETFVIDKQGRVRHKLSGPITPEVWRNTLQPLIQELQGA